MAALEGSDYRLERLADEVVQRAGDGPCHEVRSFLSHRSRWSRLASPGAPPPGAPMPGAPMPGAPMPGAGEEAPELEFGSGARHRSVWLLGDSVTYGLGVEATETFGASLSGRLADHFGAALTSLNLGIPGAGYCATARRLAAELATQEPDIVIVSFFADDLEEHSMLTVQGRLVAPPDLESNAAIRWFVERSYLANLAWYRAIATPLIQHPADGRFISPVALEEFRTAASAMQASVTHAGGSPIFLLIPTPGEALCTTPVPDARCHQLEGDLELMAQQLQAANIPFLDLRGAWPTGTAHILANDLRAIAEGGIAMHPNAMGHRLLADAIWVMLTVDVRAMEGLGARREINGSTDE